MNELNDFITYATSLDPSYPERIAGASPEEVQQLEQLVGRTLPADYKQYLAKCGHSDGGLELAMEGTTDITDIIEYYRDEVAPGDAVVPEDHIIVGLNGITFEELSIFSMDGQKSKVVFSGGGRALSMYAESFEKLIYRRAFESYAMRGWPCKAILIGKEFSSMLQDVKPVCHKLGMEVQWFSDAIAICAVARDCNLMVVQYERNKASFVLAGRNQETVGDCVAILMRSLPVVLDTPV